MEWEELHLSSPPAHMSRGGGQVSQRKAGRAHHKEIVDRRVVVVVEALLVEVLAHLDDLGLLALDGLPQVLDLRELRHSSARPCTCRCRGVRAEAPTCYSALE